MVTRMAWLPISTRLARMIRLHKLTRLTSIPSMDRDLGLPRVIRLTIFTSRVRLNRPASLDRPTRMNRLDTPDKMQRPNWDGGYTIHEAAADGRRREENKMPTRGPLKLRILFAIFQFYRPAAFRGVPGDVLKGRPLTASNNLRGNAK